MESKLQDYLTEDARLDTKLNKMTDNKDNIIKEIIELLKNTYHFEFVFDNQTSSGLKRRAEKLKEIENEASVEYDFKKSNIKDDIEYNDGLIKRLKQRIKDNKIHKIFNKYLD